MLRDTSRPSDGVAARSRKTLPTVFRRTGLLLALTIPPLMGRGLAAQEEPRFTVELEGGPVWQTRNDVQVPNTEASTRFSLIDPVGRGPWAAGRVYATWNISRKHGIRLLYAPLSVTGTGATNGPVNFAGETFPGGAGLEGTYQFNSYRLSYRYRFLGRENLRLWLGLSGKIRDAKVELTQGNLTARDTDVGFVPLLHLAADWEPASRTHIRFDLDGLAGGPGRAFDVSLKLGHDLNRRWQLSAGYRTLEGGADVSSVYAFAWLHYGVLSITYAY